MKQLKALITNFRIWWLAWLCNYPFFRVIYKDGKRTMPLYEREATGLRDVFKGKLIIDYEYGQQWLNRFRHLYES